MSIYKFTYFNVRGLGEHIRFMFKAAGVAYEDIKIPIEEWAEWKPKIKFGQLPVLEVDGKELSQSLAMSRFLAVKLDFDCKDPFHRAKADEIVDFVTELRLEFRAWFVCQDEEQKARGKEIFVNATFPRYYNILEDLAVTFPGEFIGGDKPCWQDFFVANYVDVFGDTVVGQEFVDSYPKLKKIKESVFGLPIISEYLKTRPKMIV